jgi:hypothetical protein
VAAVLSVPRGLLLLTVVLLAAAPVLAWDSPGHPPGWQQSSHELFTDWAIQQALANYPQFWHVSQPYIVAALERGADTEAHYAQYPHGGNNWGCADAEGWWQDALVDRASTLSGAYEDLGTLLHMVQDMGVPSHACHIPHGFEPGDLIFHPDNFEWMGTYNWVPTYCKSSPRTEFNGTSYGDPVYADPGQYYRFSQEWTLHDLVNEPGPLGVSWTSAYYAAPANPSNEDPGNTGYYIGIPEPPTMRADHFHRFWSDTDTFEEERCLLSKRQNRTRWVTYWALVTALPIMHRPNMPTVEVTPDAPRDDQNLVATAKGADYAGARSVITCQYEWAQSRDGGKTWSDWDFPGRTLSRAFTEPWDMWKVRARGVDDHGNTGHWAEGGPVTIIPDVDEDGDPIGRVVHVHGHPKPAKWTAAQWSAHVNAADGATWSSAFHYVNQLVGKTAAGDTILFGRGDYAVGWNGWDHVVLPSVALRGVNPADHKARTATILPGITIWPGAGKAVGLTLRSLQLRGAGTVRDTGGTVAWVDRDTPGPQRVDGHEGVLTMGCSGASVLDVEITRCRLTRSGVGGRVPGGAVRVHDNALVGDGSATSCLSVHVYVDPPGVAQAILVDNTFSGASLDAGLHRPNEGDLGAPGQLTIRRNKLTGGGIRCRGISNHPPIPATITDNEITEAPEEGLDLYRLAPLTISNNQITGAAGAGLNLELWVDTGTPAEVRENAVRGCRNGGMRVMLSRANIHDNVVAGNEDADGPGGGLWLDGNAYPVEVRDNEFLGNRALRGGGLASDGGGSPVIRGNVIRGNRATETGGGVALRHASGLFAGNTVEDNTADRGGGMYVCDAGTIERNTIVGNRALSSGGGMYLEWSGDGWNGPTNNVIAENVAVTGGGVCFGDGGDGPPANTFITLTGHTIARNRATNGGGVCVETSRPVAAHYAAVLRNCIVSDSKAGGGIRIGPHTALDLGYSNVFGNAGGNYVGVADQTGRNGNLSVNPRYADLIDGDFHLRSQAGRWSPDTNTWVKDTVTSPCIDAGDPLSPFAREPKPNGGRINMGAYGNTREASKSATGTPAAAAALTVTAAAAPSAHGSAAVTVNLSSAAAVSVTVLNVAGRVVAELPTRDLPSGLSTVLWDGRSMNSTPVPAGRYLVRITARTANGRQTQALAALSLAR